jgi:ribonuclease P protein component
LRRRDEFVATLHAGRRRSGGSRPALVVAHLATPPLDAVPAPNQATRAGLVVSRAVGGAVVRNSVKRRLRHVLAARLDALPAGSRLVVRALPAAAAASSAQLAAALDEALRLPAGAAR